MYVIFYNYKMFYTIDDTNDTNLAVWIKNCIELLIPKIRFVTSSLSVYEQLTINNK